MRHTNTNEDALTLALNALGWTLADQARAERLIALTGLTPDDLRTRAADPTVLAAVLGFLEAHEPDLVACAGSLDISPARLVAAHAELDR